MAITRLEQLSVSVPIQRYTKKEANAYDDAEREEARRDSKPMRGEAYVLLTPFGKRWVTFTACGASTVTKTRARR